jgi:hypothetical protein
MGLSIIAGGLAFVGSANATDLIVNGSFEADGDLKESGGTPGATPSGWSGFLQTYTHSEMYFAGPDIPAEENPGIHYTWQHRAVQGVNGDAGVPQVTQTVNLTAAVSAADIDAGQAQYTFSAWLASYGTPQQNPEQPYLTVQFFNVSSAQIGSTVVFDRTTALNWVRNADPSDTTPPSSANHQWSQYVKTSLVPQGSRTALVGIGRSPNAGLSGTPDTYVDLVKLDVAKCYSPVTNGLVAHLTFDNNFDDSSGNGVSGTGVNDPTFESGRLGQGIRITTTTDLSTNKYVTLGYPALIRFGSDADGSTTDFSFAFWAKIYTQSDDQAFISNKNWDSGGNRGFVIATEGDGMKWNAKDTISGRRDSPHVGPQLLDHTFHHVAVTFVRTGLGRIYIDGALVNETSVAPDTGQAVGSMDTDDLGFSVNLGQDGRGIYTDNGSASVDMTMDDLGIWRRNLTAAEVREIYTKGLAGRTLEQCAPESTTILTQPTDRTVFVGFKADFTVLASGGEPLSYQWRFNGTNIAAGTNSTLNLVNVQFNQAGSYAVVVTGVGNSVTSNPAILTVNPVPPCDLTPGLVVHLSFDGNYNDSAGYGVIGEPISTGSVDMTLPTFESGKLGQAVHILNTKDLTTNRVVKLGPDYPGVLKFGSDATSDTTDFSVSFWVNYTHNTDDQAYLSNKNWDSGDNNGWVLASQNSGGMKWNLRDDVNSRRDSPNVGAVRDGQWHNIVWTFDRHGNGTIYIDGEFVNATSMAPGAGQAVGSLDTAGLNVYIGTDGRGNYTDNGSAEIDMLFDDLGIWRRVLTATEAACIFSQGQQGTSLPTVGPRLSLTDLFFGDFQLSWPVTISDYILESSPNLNPGAIWTFEPTINNQATFSSIDPNNPIRFYRLRKSP